MSWIKHPVVLEGEHVRLVPLSNSHFEALAVAANDDRIWEHQVIDGTNRNELFGSLREAIMKRSYGEQYPFTVIDKHTGRAYGVTRFFEIFDQHKKLEIGWTWYHPDYWGTGYNFECKLLLLTYCFEVLKTNRVQIKTRVTNERSKAAIRKLGAKEEGILRKDRILPNGEVRDTIMFSIIDDEWNDVKKYLKEKVESIGVQ